ncbi:MULTISPECIES: hypothetical protein [Kitasatospora]|uniref:Uncharacterized protein n=1 Tax=Kitasatospora cystarginea TaxID=58350 RepID=A0ABN3EJ24_9ACTN
MPDPTNPSEPPVSSTDITAFADRLASWSESLSPTERSLAQVLVQYTRDLRPDDIRRGQLVAGLSDATRAVVETAKRRWAEEPDGGGWVEIGPIWQKANQTAGREEQEIVQWTYFRPEKWTPTL